MTSTTHSGGAPATASAAVRTVRILMNGVTGRMGKNQHLIRSILAIRAVGGLAVGPGQAIMPEPVLVGRNRSKLEALAAEHGVAEVTTDLDAALREQNAEIPAAWS